MENNFLFSKLVNIKQKTNNKKSLIKSSYLFLILITTTTLMTTILCGEDYYKLLGVPRDASEKQIKKAFRSLSLKYHPDRNKGNQEAADMYLKINQAYETLLDTDKRQIYDIYGEEGLNQEQNIAQRQNMPKGPNARLDLSVDLSELYNGNVKEMSISKNIICKKCHGTGGKLGHTHKCPKCQGRGVTLQEVPTGMGFSLRMQNTCPQCSGKGITFSQTCDVCRGRKIIKEDKTLRIEIEKGMKDGQTIVFPRESEQHPDTIPGDLIMVLRQIPHPFFTERQGNDLYAKFDLDIKEALLGYNKKITHLDKREFFIESKQPTQPFQVRRIDGEGMPQHKFPSNKGSLFVNFNVRLPDKLSEAEKLLVKEIFE